MKITIINNGATVTAFTLLPTDNLVVQVETDAAGETLGPVTINVAGGALNVYPHNVTKTGPISIHMFGEDKETSG